MSTPVSETVSEMEKVIACAISHPDRTVYLLAPHSRYENHIRGLFSEPVPANIRFIPSQNWLEELKPLQREKVFIAAGCAQDVNRSPAILDALAKAMMG